MLAWPQFGGEEYKDFSRTFKDHVHQIPKISKLYFENFRSAAEKWQLFFEDIQGRVATLTLCKETQHSNCE